MQKNRSTWGVGVVLGLAVLLGGISAAEAITIRSAAVQFGVAVVEGQASPNADIFWEGNPVTQANSKNGGFKVVGVVPADCVGTLVDGTTGDSEDVALDDCDPDGSGGSGAPAPVEQTGQTEPFAEGDDGDLQAGVPFPSPRFTDNLNGTVMDHLTGLIWLKDASCLGSQTWANALNAANNLAAPHCGLSDGSVAGDWRLPNVKELQSLLHFRFVNPALSNAEGTAQWTQGDAFVDVPTNPPRIYYSSTTSRNDGTSAWLVDLADGRTFTAGKQFFNLVWPVRGGQ